MKVDEFVAKLRSEIRFAGENGFCVIDPDIIKGTISIIESQRAALMWIAVGQNSDKCTTCAINDSNDEGCSICIERIARQELDKEV